LRFIFLFKFNKRKTQYTKKIFSYKFTRLALSISPDGKRLINSTPLNGVVVGGNNIHESLSK